MCGGDLRPIVGQVEFWPAPFQAAGVGTVSNSLQLSPVGVQYNSIN